MRDDEVREMGRLLMERSASTEPWKQPSRYMIEPMIKNFAGRLLAKPSHRPFTVPKKFTSTVHTE